MTRPKLVISGNIGPRDPWMEEWLGDDGMFSAEECQQFLENNADATEIEVEIRSNGGYADVAFDIHDQLRNCGKTVYIVGYNVKSAAVAIFLAAEKENRSLTKLAPFLIHKATIDPWMLGSMNTDELAALATELSEYDNKLLDLYVERTGADRSVLETEMSYNKSMTAARALELGFCSQILDGKVENSSSDKLGRFVTPMISQLVQNNKNKTAMSDKKTEERMNAFQATLNKIQNLLSNKKVSTVKNADDKSLYFDGDKIEVGTVLYEDEEKTKKAPAGSHTVGTQTIVVGEEGTVTEVKEKEVENADTDKLKKELDEEKVKNAALVKELADQKTAVENANKETVKLIADMKSEFENLKKDLIGDTGKPPKKEVENNGKMTIAEMAAARAR